MTTLLNGVLGGLLVGLLAAVAVRRVAADPSATAALSRRLPGAASSRWREGFLQVAYGALAGGLLVALELYVLGLLGVPPTPVEAFGTALAWSAVLFVSLLTVARLDTPAVDSRSTLLELAVFHLVFGLGLGLWIRMTWIT